MTTSQSIRQEAVAVGLLAAGSVALFYAVLDQLAARGALYTVNLLGLALFRGVRDPAILQLPIPLDQGAILAYSALHVGLALAIGFIVTGLIARAERHPEQGQLMLGLIAAGFFATVFAIALLTVPLSHLLPRWSIVVANACAVVVVAAYLLRRHPGLAGRLMRPDGG